MFLRKDAPYGAPLFKSLSAAHLALDVAQSLIVEFTKLLQAVYLLADPYLVNSFGALFNLALFFRAETRPSGAHQYSALLDAAGKAANQAFRSFFVLLAYFYHKATSFRLFGVI